MNLLLQKLFFGVYLNNTFQISDLRQHLILQYIADFYCHKLKLVIEIDGSIHDTEEVKNNDKLREEFLQTLNLKIIRFTNDEVCKNKEVL